MKDSFLLIHIEWHRCYQNTKEFNLILENNSLLSIHVTKKGNIDGPNIRELNNKLNIHLYEKDLVKIGEIDDKNIFFYNHTLDRDKNEDEDGYIHDSPPIVQNFNQSENLKIIYNSNDIDDFTQKSLDLLYTFLSKFGKYILESCGKNL